MEEFLRRPLGFKERFGVDGRESKYFVLPDARETYKYRQGEASRLIEQAIESHLTKKRKGKKDDPPYLPPQLADMIADYAYPRVVGMYTPHLVPATRRDREMYRIVTRHVEPSKIDIVPDFKKKPTPDARDKWLRIFEREQRYGPNLPDTAEEQMRVTKERLEEKHPAAPPIRGAESSDVLRRMEKRWRYEADLERELGATRSVRARKAKESEEKAAAADEARRGKEEIDGEGRRRRRRQKGGKRKKIIMAV